MIKKYNIAFIPQTKADDIRQLASRYKMYFGQYSLGVNSFAHVTLLHFYMDESKIERAWINACSLVQQNIKLSFYSYSYLTFDGQIFWISLLPDNQDILYGMHLKICSLLKIKKDIFDPHMTLFCTEKEIPENVIPMKTCQPLVVDNFILALGESDDIGQLNKIIYKTFCFLLCNKVNATTPH